MLVFNAIIKLFIPSSENKLWARDNDLTPGFVPRYYETIFIDSSFIFMFVKSINWMFLKRISFIAGLRRSFFLSFMFRYDKVYCESIWWIGKFLSSFLSTFLSKFLNNPKISDSMILFSFKSSYITPGGIFPIIFLRIILN